MKFYRIKEIDGVFIPQVALSIGDYIFNSWKGIDNNCFITWYLNSFQKEYCSYSSLEEANNVITKYKNHNKPDKPKVKYHKYNGK